MISFELKKPVGSLPDELEIYVDKEGVTSLIAQLELLCSNKTDHVHLMNESWGGSHLSPGVHNSENSEINHVKVVLI